MDTNEKASKKNNRKSIGILVFVVGLVGLISGASFLLYSLLKVPDMRDAEYLVEVGTWQLENDSTVVWDFTEIGKGKLTTNFYINEYDFIWAMDGDQLKIETDWLYTLNNAYTYILDQGAKKLTLADDNGSYVFVPLVKEPSTEQEQSQE